MQLAVSADIQELIDWEVAHGNAIEGVYQPFGLPVVAMQQPLVKRHHTALWPPSLDWWEFKDPHYSAAEWCAGYVSATSGHKICGPLADRLHD
jgi:hypothetical protein